MQTGLIIVAILRCVELHLEIWGMNWCSNGPLRWASFLKSSPVVEGGKIFWEDQRVTFMQLMPKLEKPSGRRRRASEWMHLLCCNQTEYLLGVRMAG